MIVCNIPDGFGVVCNTCLHSTRKKKSILAPWVLDQSIIVTQVSQDHHTTCFMYPCTLPSLTTLRDSGSRPSGMRHRKTPLTQSPSHPGSLLPDKHNPSQLFSVSNQKGGESEGRVRKSICILHKPFFPLSQLFLPRTCPRVWSCTPQQLLRICSRIAK